jgi:transcriptional regulator with XRE-family HTH domain
MTSKTNVCPYPPNQVRRYRRMRGLRIVDVGKMLGLRCPVHVSHWEKGRKLPSLRNAFKLSVAISAPVEILFAELYNEVRSNIRSVEWQRGIKRTYD